MQSKKKNKNNKKSFNEAFNQTKLAFQENGKGNENRAKVGAQLIFHHRDDIDFQLQYGGTFL